MLPFGFRLPMSKASSNISRCVVSPASHDDCAVVQLLRARGDRLCWCLRSRDDNRNRQRNRAGSFLIAVSGLPLESRAARRRSGSLLMRATPENEVARQQSAAR